MVAGIAGVLVALATAPLAGFLAAIGFGLLLIGGDVGWRRRKRRKSSIGDASPKEIDEAAATFGKEFGVVLQVMRKGLQQAASAMPGTEAAPPSSSETTEPVAENPKAESPAAKPILTRARAQERRKATLIRFMDQGEEYRERITRAAYPSPPSLIGNPMAWPILEVLLIKWLSELHEYALLELSEGFVRRIPSLRSRATTKDGLDAIDVTISLIEKTLDAMT